MLSDLANKWHSQATIVLMRRFRFLHVSHWEDEISLRLQTRLCSDYFLLF